MKLFNTKPGLTDVICTTITEWFDSGTVTTVKYHDKYHPAINSQSEIGWRHLFKGKISKEWQILQGRTQMQNQQFREPEVWAAGIVEISLRGNIEVWKERCASVHDESNLQEKHYSLQRLKDKAQALFDVNADPVIVFCFRRTPPNF